MDVLKIAVPERREDPGRDWFAVDPDVMYPAALDYLAAIRRGEVKANSPEIAQEMAKIKLHALPDDTFKVARMPVNFAGGRALERRMVLECARLVFTALLHQANRRPIGVHILRKGNWRL